MHTLTLLLTTLLSYTTLTFAQITNNMPATVFLTAYKLDNCIMSEDFSTFNPASSYAVTSGYCYNSTYEFTSYYASTNYADNTPCAMSIWPQPDCTGTSTGVNATQCGGCSPVSTELGGTGKGWSFKLACGP